MGLKIGITGGIGSGKSTICRVFQALGVPVFDADSAAKELMESDEELKKGIAKEFGQTAYFSDGKLDRAFLAAQVFGNDEALIRLNALVHPAVIEFAEEWAAKQASPYSIKEAALLFESGSYRFNDYNILVKASVEVRVSRVMNRDGVSAEQVHARIAKQMDEAEKEKMADFVINNEGDIPVIPQVLALHAHFLKISQKTDFNV